MRRVPTILVAISVAAESLIAGCHRPPAATGAAPLAWPPEDYCWWAPFRTGLPPDSVAVRFARAFATLGLSGALSSQQGDTAWAEAGPTLLSDSAWSGTYAARVVAFRRGDSTLFRTFVGAHPRDSSNLARHQIGFCAQVMRAARAGAIAPRTEEPDDTLPLWRRRP